jgi:hypothetical protein
VKHFQLLGQTLTPDGTILKLTCRDAEYIILVNGKSLMSSGMHGSEEPWPRSPAIPCESWSGPAS